MIKAPQPLGTPLHIRLTSDLHLQLAKLAGADRRTVSDYVRLLLEEAVARKPDKRTT